MSQQNTNIQAYTGLSTKEYELILTGTLLNCLSQVAATTQALQLLLIDRSINKWFLTQVNKVNTDFIQCTQPYKHLGKEHLKISYRRFIQRIEKNYPNGLVDNITVSQIRTSTTRFN